VKKDFESKDSLEETASKLNAFTISGNYCPIDVAVNMLTA
jgi:hypothetical protein